MSFRRSCVLLFTWFLASVLLAGCASAPYSFRLSPSPDAGEKWLLPPGTTRGPEKLTLLVEASFLDRCPVVLPRHLSDSIKIDAPRWDAVHRRVLRVELMPVLARYAPIAACLNTQLREPKNCIQNELAESIRQQLASDPSWAKCLPDDTNVLASELRDSLPFVPKYTSAFAGLATYDDQSKLQFLRLMAGSVLCISRDYGASPRQGQAWLSVNQSCKRFLAAGADGAVTLDRQDEASHFGFATRFNEEKHSVVYEARSWITVRAAAAAVFDGHFHAYVYFPRVLNYGEIPLPLELPSSDDHSLRFFPLRSDKDAENEPIPVGPVLVLRSRDRPLAGLAQDPKLKDLCLLGRCFFAPDEGAMDVFLPVQINGRPQLLPFGALPMDWPELAVARTVKGYRNFHGRLALLDFDLTDIGQGIPITANDVFWSRPR